MTLFVFVQYKTGKEYSVIVKCKSFAFAREIPQVLRFCKYIVGKIAFLCFHYRIDFIKFFISI
jgi:hypothetical protein